MAAGYVRIHLLSRRLNPLDVPLQLLRTVQMTAVTCVLDRVHELRGNRLDRELVVIRRALKLQLKVAQPIRRWRHERQAWEHRRDLTGEMASKVDRAANVWIDVAKMSVPIHFAGPGQKNTSRTERVIRSAILQPEPSVLDDVDLKELRRLLFGIVQS